MYHMRFGQDVPPGTTLQQLRGLEGQRMKALYKIFADQHRIGRFRRNYDPRNWHDQDPVNQALSAANTSLYGVVHAAILAIGCSPALGFVHTGKQHSFVYDIADLYKARTTIPLAFSLHASTDPEAEARRKLREQMRLIKLLPNIVKDIQTLLDPDHDHDADSDDEDPERTDVPLVELWDPRTGTVPMRHQLRRPGLTCPP